MASLDELIDHAQGNLSQIDEVTGSIDATKAMADELSSLFAALTVHGLAEGSQELKEMAEQAQQQLAAAKLKLEELITAAEVLKTLTSGPGPSGPSATVAVVGAPLTAPGEAPKDYRAELAGSDDDDKSRNRFARGARAAIRKAGDLKKQAETTAKAHSGMSDAYRPPPGGTYETVGVPPPITSSFKGAASGKAGAHDEVGTAVIVTALVVEWGSRMFNNRKARRDGK